MHEGAVQQLRRVQIPQCRRHLGGGQAVTDKVWSVFALSDEVLLVGDRYYIQATATAIETATGAQESASALAREPEEKKKLGASQVTGMASSYARKYALGGLFGIDDAKDADAYPAEEPPDYVRLLKHEVSRLGLSWAEVKAEVQGRFEKTSLKELTPLEWTRLIEIYQERKNEYV